MSREDYVVLYSGLDEKEAAEVFTKLEELGVKPKLDGTSTILVPEDQEPQLRMQMAMEGYPKSGFNYDIYLQSSSFGQTDEEMQKRWIIQLQERLSQSIRYLKGIEDAVVTIAMPETDSFVLKDNEVPVTASVIVLPRPGYEISYEQAKSIEQLVEKSIPGLEAENISIIDNEMNVLNAEQSDENQLTSNQFELEQQLENKLKSRVEDLLEPVFGYGSVKAAVDAKLNFYKKVTESVKFEPVLEDEGTGIIVSQELLKEKVNNTYSGGVPGVESNAETTEYVNPDGENSSSQRQEERINYEINEIKEKIEGNNGNVEDLSIAVVIDRTKLDLQQDPEIINQVKELVAMAIGIDDETKVAVQSWDFNTDLQDDIMEAFGNRQQAQEALFGSGVLLAIVIAVVIILIIGMIIIIRMKRKEKLLEELEQEADELDEAVAVEDKEQSIDLEFIQNQKQSEIKKQLDKFAAERPEAVAQLLRNWLSED